MKLVDFLTKVVSNPGWQRRFCDDPEGTIEQANLDDASLDAIRSGDPKKVAALICMSPMKIDPID